MSDIEHIYLVDGKELTQEEYLKHTGKTRRELWPTREELKQDHLVSEIRSAKKK